MRVIFIFSFLFLLVPKSSQSQRNLATMNEAWNKFMSAPGISNAQSGISIVSSKTGIAVFDKNSKQNLMPASSLKTLTGLLALENFDTRHTFQTHLGYSGTINADRVLEGNIVVECQGDPAFMSSRTDHYKGLLDGWAQSIKSMNISGIQGALIIDESYFEGFSIASGVLFDDPGNYYAGGSSACSFIDNTQVLKLRSYGIGTKVECLSQHPELYINYNVQAIASQSNKDEAFVIGVPGSYDRFIIGSIPANRDSFEIEASLPEPSHALASEFQRAFVKAGINVDMMTFVFNKNPATKPTYTVIQSKTSIPLLAIVQQMEKESINLYADVLLRHCAKKNSISTDLTSAAGLLEKRTKDKYASLYDGAGLSRKNLISPLSMCNAILSFDSQIQSQIQDCLKSDINETRKVYCKTGYMEGIRARSGFLFRNGEKYVFSFMVNNYNGNSLELRKVMDELIDGISAGL